MRLSGILTRLSLGVSALSLTAGLVSAQTSDTETVIVTGTHISGVVSTGSTVTTLSQEDLQKTASPDAYYALQSLPQTFNVNSDTVNFGGARPGGAPSNQGLGNFFQLRGVGQTLVLYNGQRVAGTGSGDNAQVDLIPGSLLQRVDVQADGGSAIYGSDALTGTVNFVMMTPKTVLRVSGQDTFKRGYSSWYGNVLAGRTWSGLGSLLGEGGIIASYQYTSNGSVSARALPWAFNDNLVPYEGAAGAYPIQASPGNVTGLGNTTASKALVYPIPESGIAPNGQLTLGQLGSSNTPNRSSLYENLNAVQPRYRQNAFAFNIKQDIAGVIHAFAYGFANSRKGYANYGTTPQFQTNISVPNTNPFSPCATGAAAALAGLAAPSQTNSQGLTCPTNGTISVPYSFTNETGPNFRLYTDKNYMLTAGFDVALPYKWTAHASESMSYDVLLAKQTNIINATALAQVVSGTGKPSNVPFFNPFCSDQNAPCNDPLTLNYIDSYKGAFQTNRTWDFNANAQGPILDLPAGPLQLALGYEYLQEYSIVGANATTGAAVGLLAPVTFAQSHRFSPQAYAEAYIPVVSPEMNVPFVQSLNFDAAVRYASYTLPKVHTSNPKYSFTWQVVDDLKLRGSFGTSFLAPGLGDSNPLSSSNVNASTNAYTCGLFPGINLASCPNGASSALSAFYIAGGNSSLHPEKGKSWTLGADITPSFLPGFNAAVTYYKLAFTDRFTQPGVLSWPGGSYNAGYLDKYLIFNPTYFTNGRAVVTPFAKELVPSLTLGAALTPADFTAAYNALFALPQYSGGTRPSNPVAFFGDGRQNNSGSQKTDGFDFSASYAFATDYGAAHVGLTGTYVSSLLDQPVSGGATFERDNQFGFALRLRGRLEAGIEMPEGFSGTVYLNYQNPYTSDPQYVPASALALHPEYTNIAGNITWDLALGYSTGDAFSEYYGDNVRLQLMVKNLLDKKPPFFLNAATSPAILFDSQEGNPLGRTISVSLTKDF